MFYSENTGKGSDINKQLTYRNIKYNLSRNLTLEAEVTTDPPKFLGQEFLIGAELKCVG